MNILELFAHVGLKADTGPAESFLKSIGGIKGALVGAVAGTLSLATAVRTVNEQFSQALDMKKFADDTGESVEEMQKWKAVAQQVSGAGDSVASSIRAITSNQEKIRMGQGSISGYQLLGIDPRSDPFKVLEAIRTKTQGLSQGMRRNIAAQFGVSNDLVSTLELTNAQFEEMAANAFVIPQGNIDSMNKARASLETVKNAANWFKAALVTQLAPAITDISKKIADWVRQNKEGLVKGIQTLFEWITRVVTMVVRVGGVINSAINSTIGWKNALMGIGVAFLALNAAVALPVAGILVLMAVIEDLAVYSRGGKSAFGLLVKEFPVLGKVFDDAFAGLKGIAATLKAIFTGDFTDLDKMISNWGIFGDILDGVARSVQMLKDAGQYIGGLFGGDETAKKSSQSKLAKSEIGFLDTLGRIYEKVGLGGAWDNIMNAPVSSGQSLKQQLTSITVAPVITINGATDPAATGAAVKGALTKEVGSAYTQSQSGKRER